MKITVKGELRECGDCGSSHLGAPCGLSYAKRLASQSADTLWMPAKNNGRKNYYDSDSLKELFPEDAKEEMMEVTKGRGPWKPGDSYDYAAELLGGDDDE